MQQDYLSKLKQKSAFMRAQHIKDKLDEHIKIKEDIYTKQYKLPNLNSIVSRNCNIINDSMTYPIQEKL